MRTHHQSTKKRWFFHGRGIGQDEGLPAIRLGARAAHFVLDDLTEEDSPWHETEEEVAVVIAAMRDQHEQLERVRMAMKKCLRDSDAQLIEMRYFNDLTLQEIGDLIGRDKSTVLRRVRSALARLRKYFDAED